MGVFNSRCRTWSRVLAVVLFVSACGGEGSGDADSDSGNDTSQVDEQGLAYLSPAERLNRISMAVRGVRPSSDELAQVSDDPAALESVVDGYLEDPRFGVIVRDLHNEALLSRVDYFIPPAGFLPKGVVAGADVYELNRSIMDAPLRLIERVVLEDRPYTEIVTANYTMANAHVAGVWGLPHSGEANPEVWEESQWQDDRGNAGILTDGWLFTRHDSTIANANRGRANAISRALLCEDFLARDIDIDPQQINLADPNVVADAVKTDAACVSCHQSLDPLASFFSGYFPQVLPSAVTYPHDNYSKGLFSLVYGVNMRDPGYFGFAGETLPDLGALIASDPRFSLCAAKRFYSYFHQVPLEEVPHETAAQLQRSFIDSGYSARELVRAIVLDDAFHVSHVDLEALGEVEPSEEALAARGYKKLRPVQLKLLLQETASFQWKADISQFQLGTIDLIDDSFVGFQVLGGGIDGYYVTRPAHTYNATASLLLRTAARDAAGHVVERDFQAEPGTRTLLTVGEPNDTSEGRVREQLVDLYVRLLGRQVASDSLDIDQTYELFTVALAQAGSPSRAWKIVVAALMQDIWVAYY